VVVMFATKSITETTSIANISYIYNMYKNLEIYPPRASGTNVIFAWVNEVSVTDVFN
jgi:hypothetical protein